MMLFYEQEMLPVFDVLEQYFGLYCYKHLCTLFLVQHMLLLSNIQSIKSKGILLIKHLNNNNIDIAVITEMWLNDDTDKAWVLTSEVNRNGYHLDMSNQLGKRGGGLALISRSYLKARKIMEVNQKMFQHAIWKVETHGNLVTCIVIYRSLYSLTNQETVTKCLDKFTEWLSNIPGSFSNMIVLGDFNIHINDKNDNDAGIFVDTITALGFNQHVTFPTHWVGNILDCVFTETCNSNKVKSCGPHSSRYSYSPTITIYTKKAYKIQKAQGQ